MMNSVTKKVDDITIEEPSVDIETNNNNIPVPTSLLRPIATRPKFLMGTGPTNLSQRVSEAICKPLMGLYMDETHQVLAENLPITEQNYCFEILRSFRQ